MRTERVSRQTLQERACRVEELKARAREISTDRRKPSTTTTPLPTTDDHVAATFPSDLSTRVKVRSQALLNTLQALSHASEKIDASAAALDSDTRLQNLVTQVSARRAMLFAELSSLFRVSVVDLDGSEGGAGVPNVTAALNRFENQWSGDNNDNEDSSSSTQDRQGNQRVAINGCAIDPATWRHAFEDDGGGGESQSSPIADRDTSIALGFAGEIVSIASRILDVPLRYPVVLRGSHSQVADGDKTFPLFVDNGKEARTRFAVGVFLLNKDVHQLLASCVDTPGDSTDSSHSIDSGKDFIGPSLLRLMTATM